MIMPVYIGVFAMLLSQQTGHVCRYISNTIFKSQIPGINDVTILNFDRVLFYEVIKGLVGQISGGFDLYWTYFSVPDQEKVYLVFFFFI